MIFTLAKISIISGLLALIISIAMANQRGLLEEALAWLMVGATGFAGLCTIGGILFFIGHFI